MTWSRTNLEDDILWVPMGEADAEIERLRGLEAAFHAEIKAMRDTIPPLIEDNERLREQLDAQATMIAECEDERMRLRHTVAIHKRRVREALGG